MKSGTVKFITAIGIIGAIAVLGLGLLSAWNNKDKVIPEVKNIIDRISTEIGKESFTNEIVSGQFTQIIIEPNWAVLIEPEDEDQEEANKLSRVYAKSDDQLSKYLIIETGILHLKSHEESESKTVLIKVKNIESLKINGASEVQLSELRFKNKLKIELNSMGNLVIQDSNFSDLELSGLIAGDIGLKDTSIKNLTLSLGIQGQFNINGDLENISGILSGRGSLNIEKVENIKSNSLILKNFDGEIIK